MKSFLITILAISCVAFLFLGNMYWKERTSISATSDTAGTETKSSDEAVAEENEDDQVKEEAEAVEPEEDVDVQTLISNWPEKAQQRFITLREEGTPFKVAVVGSNAMGVEENGWAPQLKGALTTSYGDQIEVELFQYDLTSIDFINGTESDEVISTEPDLVLLEPFSLVDNSNSVGTVQNHDSILMFQNRLNEVNEEGVLVLQPPHPLAGATYYPEQIESLEEFAVEEGITYIDHWTGWPEEDELVDYLIESQDTPNEKGHELWADELMEYFISE
jgi:hypothetical protein